MRKILLTLVLCGLVLQTIKAQNGEQDWVQLFNGKNLDGWKKLNGKAEYKVEGNTITGYSRMNTPNTFLATEKNYGDFILELEVKVDNELNSGIQIRTNSLKDYKNGRVHGYQVEIDPSPRAYSGGVYDESRRGWLYPLGVNPKGRKAFRPGSWNKYRIEAIGNHIRTWVNDQMCSNLVDDITAEGFIALQVHSIGNEKQVGTQVKWRNIRVKTVNLEDERWPADTEVPEISYLVNKLTSTEKRQGWRLLWDGKTSNGWQGAKIKDFPKSGWEIKDGILSVLATDGGESTGPGDIITSDQFGDFVLELEFMMTEGANSGIKYFVDPSINKGSGSAIGCEYQILDDSKHPDAKMGVGSNRTLASLYDLIPAENIAVKQVPKSRAFKGVGNWNKARIYANNGKVEHWLNNEKMVEYDRWSQAFKALVNYSKYKNWPDFGRWSQGPILLQDHGNTVHFRSIKIKEL